jgi:plasmid replication initiation protein
MRYIVALYEIDRAYGGPEEGGWHFDTGELARLLALSATEDRARALADRANRLLDRLQRQKRTVDSVLYAGGRYTAVVYEWTAPARYPEYRPHYA